MEGKKFSQVHIKPFHSDPIHTWRPGNRKTKTDSVTGNTQHLYNNANLLTDRTGFQYSNDSNGNRYNERPVPGGTGVTKTYSFDSQNRMVRSVIGSGANQKTTTMTYGSDGLRRKMVVQTGDVASTAQFTETKYVLEGQSVVQEIVRQKVGQAGSWTTPVTVNYLMGPSGPLARTTSNTADARWFTGV